MATKMSKQTIMQMLDLNQMTNVRSSPMNPAVSRSQTRNYPEGGNGAKFVAGDHIIVNLQTGTNWIDVLQSFLVFDVRCTEARVGLVRNSALSLFSECQVIADNRDVDRTRFLNVLNYRRVAQMSINQKDLNYNALFMANPFSTAEADEASYNILGRGAIGDGLQRVMIPLKFLGGIFDSYKLMPPHLARGLRIDITCEAVNRALTTAFGQAPVGYEISGVNILTDSYRMDTAILEYINSEYASSKDGLIYEYFSYNSAKSTNATDAINIEFNQSSSQTVDALVVQTLAAEKNSIATDSFKSAVVPAGARSQWRIGSHYMPNQLTDGIVEHYAQYMYYLNGLRENKELAMTYNSFVGSATGAGGITFGRGDGAFAQTFQRSNLVEVSGMAVNMNSSLGFLAEGVTQDCDVYIFVRHLRRAVLFLQSMTLET